MTSFVCFDKSVSSVHHSFCKRIQRSLRATISISMAESDQEFSSSTSEEDLESSESMEEDLVSITNQVSPYQGEPLADSDSNGEGSEDNGEGDEDGLTPATLERRFDKTEPVSSWYV